MAVWLLEDGGDDCCVLADVCPGVVRARARKLRSYRHRETLLLAMLSMLGAGGNRAGHLCA